jgi:uncharacterized protein (TIGR00730 family)
VSELSKICVFCGSSSGKGESFRQAAAQVGAILAAKGITLVYGGAHVGTMGALADACLAAQGKVIGVMPQRLVDREVAHAGLTELHVVDSMHTRKALMADLSDAFIALPGGFGTYDELFEILTWAQIGMHGKPVGLLNVGGFYTPLLAFLQNAVDAGFVQPRHLAMLQVAETVEELLGKLAQQQVPVPGKWTVGTDA